MRSAFMLISTIALRASYIKVASQSLPCRTANGDSCPSVICPNTVVNYTCTIPLAYIIGYTDWVLPTGTCLTNTIRLSQSVSAGCAPQGSSICGPYRASSIQSSDPTFCPSSILTVNITSAVLNGSTVTCSSTSNFNTANTFLISSAIINVAVIPGPVSPLTVNSTSVSQLTAVWATPTAGGTPTNYSVGINGSRPVVIANNGSSLYTYTFTGLISNTLYTVSVVAINCAGTSNVTTITKQTMAPPPSNTNVLSVFNNFDDTFRQLEITWTPVGGSVTIYGVYVGGILHGNTRCTTSPCFYVVPVSGPSTSYAISVASINGGGIGPMSGPAYNVPSNTVISSILSDTTSSSATVSCSFLNNQSFYCVVCCSMSSDSFAPPVSFVYNISTTNNTMVTVTLQGLDSGQLYYCKAAATNTNSPNCGVPVVGGVKLFLSFRTNTSQSPTPTPTPSLPSKMPNSGASIDTHTAIGISVAITFIISFSLGGLVTAIIICGCYIPRVSSVTNESVPPATAYKVVGINQKEIIAAIELESNAAYGTSR